AKEMLLEKYPDVKIEVLDTTVDTVLQGLLVLEVCRMQRAGWSFEDTVKRTKEILPTGRIIFTVGSFDYLVHGGRIGKVMGAAVKSLAIKPLIILKEGEIFPAGVFRNREKGKKTLVSLCRKHFEKSGENPDEYAFNIGYGYDHEEAVAFREMLLSDLKQYSGIQNMELFQIGATIGVHTGPYPIGLTFIKKAF
ncbi:MAG: DegV family EDD domain-containing protein, partial [Lachnospiraceae bacterium]|nr:DegV family EDD domain-containing protein [Lachnospiraceae bacterium]